MLRITNNSLRDIFLDTTQRAQQRLAVTQRQVATGLRVNQPSDDPLAAAQIRELEASISRVDQLQRNSVIAENRLGLEEELLADVIEILQRARELAVQGNNATQTSETRASMALELQEQMRGLLDLANAIDSGGRHIFSGFSEGVQPFSFGAGGVIYAGDQGQRMIQIGDSRVVADGDSGSRVFLEIRNGNGTFALSAGSANTGTGVLGAGALVNPSAYTPDTYTITFTTPTSYEIRDSAAALVTTGTYSPGQPINFAGISIGMDGSPQAGDTFAVTPSANQDIFSMLDQLSTTLANSSTSPAGLAQLNNEVGQRLVDIDQSITHLLGVRAEVGARMRSIDQQNNLNEGFSIQIADTLSALRDIDYAEALSLLNQQMFGLEAAQQTYVRLQGLSLFRFL